MNTKICKICKVEKDYSEFNKMKGCIGDVRTVCKECRKLEHKEYCSREYVIERQKTYYQDNKITIRKRLNNHYWTLNGQYHNYKKSAKKRNLEFNLTEKDCIPYYNTTCSYCGDKITGIGIDRINNDMGYVKGNMTPCCSTCNLMKHSKNKNEFITHIEKIYKNLNK